MPALQFIHSSYERRQCSSLDIAGGHFLRLRAAALALRGPPLQMKLSHHRRMSRLDRRGFWHLKFSKLSGGIL